MAASVGELDVRARDQVAHGASNKRLAGTSECRDSGSDVYRDAGEVETAQFALASVETGSNTKVESARTVGDRLGTADNPNGILAAN